MPYTYRVKEARKDGLLLDLAMGAEHALDPEGLPALEPGDVVKTRRDGALYEAEA